MRLLCHDFQSPYSTDHKHEYYFGSAVNDFNSRCLGGKVAVACLGLPQLQHYILVIKRGSCIPCIYM